MTSNWSTARALIACVISLVPMGAFAQSVPSAQVLDTATRGVRAIEASQAIWYDHQVCSSCHQQYQPAIAFAVARAHGVPVNEALVEQDGRRDRDFTNFGFARLDDAIQFRGPIEPVLQEGYRLLAVHAAGRKPDLTTNLTARMLIARQRPSGDWSGLNQRPPSSSSDFTKTAIGLRVVQLFHHPADAAASRSAIARAAAWLESHRGVETEDRTYQLLGLHWAGARRGLLSRLARELASTQQSDGGWGSVAGRASEAYSTGEALVALHEAGGMTTSDPVWKRGVAFLIRTQAADGTWHVPSRLHEPARLSPPYFESGYPYGHDQFISAHGTAWAVMALASALPPAPLQAPRQQWARAPEGVQAWMETALFGSLAELKRLLDDGLDPNASTVPGRTSLLMMVASDVEKVRLLIDRGANVNARAASGFTPLMVAAQFTKATPVLSLLLQAGAKHPASDEGRRASPGDAIALAAHAGNAAGVGLLHQAGEPVTGRWPLVARAAVNPTAMALAIRNGDLEVVRTLLDLGADVNVLDDVPWSPLESAVHNNRVALAQLFLQRGALVNAVDRAGYTPLLLAASVDFGDTAMLDLLLDAGADTSVKTPAGKTAWDLATEYQHKRFLPSLERATRKQSEGSNSRR